MSSGYSANQYESAFKSHKLQNWTVPKHFKERPSAAEGHTTFIATDHGHLLPGVKSKHGSARTSFVGTWDLPSRIPPAYINPTSRSKEGQERLRTWGQDQRCLKTATNQPQEVLEARGGSKATNPRTPGEEQSANQERPHVATPMPVASPAPNVLESAPERPESQPTPAPERPASQTPSLSND